MIKTSIYEKKIGVHRTVNWLVVKIKRNSDFTDSFAFKPIYELKDTSTRKWPAVFCQYWFSILVRQAGLNDISSYFYLCAFVIISPTDFPLFSRWLVIRNPEVQGHVHQPLRPPDLHLLRHPLPEGQEVRRTRHRLGIPQGGRRQEELRAATERYDIFLTELPKIHKNIL